MDFGQENQLGPGIAIGLDCQWAAVSFTHIEVWSLLKADILPCLIELGY